jgi:hypothetical protein
VRDKKISQRSPCTGADFVFLRLRP